MGSASSTTLPEDFFMALSMPESTLFFLLLPG
jgi:hypothetical protein